MDNIDDTIKTECNKLDVIFLQNESVIIENITIFGCTLFSDVTINDSNIMNDIHQIGNRNLLLQKFETHKKWLISNNFTNTQKNIIITHHVPFASNTENSSGYYTDIINKYFSNINCEFINYWICGHTHTNICETINNIKIRSCCIGYPGEIFIKPRPSYINV